MSARSWQKLTRLVKVALAVAGVLGMSMPVTAKSLEAPSAQALHVRVAAVRAAVEADAASRSRDANEPSTVAQWYNWGNWNNWNNWGNWGNWGNR